MTKYKVIKEKIINENGEKYISYGIAAYENKREVARISDITPSRSELVRLVGKCNKNQAELVHLHDIIEDFLLQ